MLDHMNRKDLYKIYLEEELKVLRKCGHKKMNTYWQHVEKFPIKENYRHVMEVMQLPMQLLAAPNLRSELLALRGKENESKNELNLVEDFLKKESAKT
jgi:hypothetical protein